MDVLKQKSSGKQYTLQMEALQCFETSVTIFWLPCYNIPEASIFIAEVVGTRRNEFTTGCWAITAYRMNAAWFMMEQTGCIIKVRCKVHAQHMWLFPPTAPDKLQWHKSAA